MSGLGAGFPDDSMVRAAASKGAAAHKARHSRIYARVRQAFTGRHDRSLAAFVILSQICSVKYFARPLSFVFSVSRLPCIGSA